MKLNYFQIDCGSIRHRIGRVWIPDGLHIWVGNRGVHLFWKASPYGRRISFDRLTHKGEE